MEKAERAYASEEERIKEHLAEAKKMKADVEHKIENLNIELGVELMRRASNEIINSIKSS